MAKRCRLLSLCHAELSQMLRLLRFDAPKLRAAYCKSESRVVSHRVSLLGTSELTTKLLRKAPSFESQELLSCFSSFRVTFTFLVLPFAPLSISRLLPLSTQIRLYSFSPSHCLIPLDCVSRHIPLVAFHFALPEVDRRRSKPFPRRLHQL